MRTDRETRVASYRDKHGAYEVKVLPVPFAGYSFRCEGSDHEGNYASKLGSTPDKAIDRWMQETHIMRIQNREARRFRK